MGLGRHRRKPLTRTFGMSPLKEQGKLPSADGRFQPLFWET